VLISDAERELLFERLKLHAAAGRLGAETALTDLPAIEGTAPAPRARSRGRHGESDRPAPDWRPTSERFRDPRTGRVMRVWEDPSGGRHYVSEDRS
jgi:hypothetical protein